MTFMVIRSPSPYNGIIRRPGISAKRAVPSTAYGMLKFPVDGGIVTIYNTTVPPREWVKELSHVLWAHRTTIKVSTGDTPFSLVYGTEAIIPAEIGMPTIRTTEVNVVTNDDERRIDLDLLEERRKCAAICRAKAKSKMKGYYDAKVRGVSFRPGDFVYRANGASHVEDAGKLRPKWEGPYEVTEALVISRDAIFRRDTMADQRTMVELLRVPTEGYAEAIVVPSILTELFELKHSLINMMTSDQFFELEKDNPHDHIRWFNKITSTIKYKDVPNSAIKLMLFPFSLAGAACWWLEKEPPCSILTWDDLVSKFINEYFPSSRTTNLRNEISNFQQRFDESFHEAWDRYKDLLRTCPHHGFTELHQLDTFYNALNPADQDSLNSASGGNLLERRTQDVLTIIENKSKIAKLTHAVNQQTSAMTTVMTAILKQFQATPHLASVKVVEEIYVTCGGAYPYYQCLAAGGNTFPEPRDNIQGYVAAAVVNYNQGNSVYRPPAAMLKKLPKKLGDPGKFLIPCGFSKLKCKALANLDASIKLMLLSVWKKLGLPELISTRMTLELANLAICTPAGIARDVFVLVGKFTFPGDFVIVDYESDPRVPLILGRSFLRTARALINVHGEEMILLDGDERLTLNMRHDTSSYSNQPQKESINLINVFNDSKGGNVLPEKLLDLDFTKDLYPRHHVSTTSSSSPNKLLEEFVDALITFLSGNDDLSFDIESNLKEIEYLLHHDPIKDIDSILKDSINQNNLVDLNDNLVDSVPEMFADKHALDYSSLPLYDEYDDDLFEVESDTENVYDDPFDSKGEKIKESKLLVDKLDLLCDCLFPSKYDSFISKDFSEVDALPSTNNEDKVFNPGILIQENLFEVITHVALENNENKLAIFHASLTLEDFDPPLYELPFFKEVPRSKILLSFLSKNEEKVFKPGIHTSEKVHSSLFPELSHQGYKVFKINQILKSPMKIFLFSYGENIHIVDVPCLYFYPVDQFKYGGLGQAKRP
nr:reverse transcriptase domain-containing protein [Tanacetum cinerariifolium]